MNKPFIIVLILFFSFSACQKEEECDKKTDVYMYTGLYTINEEKKESFTADTLSIEIDGIDTVFQYSDAENFTLSLDPLTDYSTLYLYCNDTIDTVSVHYMKMTRLVTYKCGFVYYFDISTVNSTTNIIDSVIITKSIVDLEDEENIQIYF